MRRGLYLAVEPSGNSLLMASMQIRELLRKRIAQLGTVRYRSTKR